MNEIIQPFINIILNILKQIHKSVKKAICGTCNGHGYIKCKCMNVTVLGSCTHPKIPKNVWIFSPLITNKGNPRKIEIKCSIIFIPEEKTIKSKTKSVKIPGCVTNERYSDLIKLEIKDLRRFEKKLERTLNDSDFYPKTEIVNLKPLINCEFCKGKGKIKCPSCKGRRILFHKKSLIRCI